MEKKMERVSTWCENGDGKTWNVDKAEKQIASIKQFTLFYRGDGKLEGSANAILSQLFKDDAFREVVKDAAKEMAEIMDNKDNSSGYHINHVTSGKIAYCVFSTEGDKAYTTDGVEYNSREEAEKKAETYEDAYVEERDGKNSGKVWIVYSEDEEATKTMKEEGLGHYVSEFDTSEEAEAEAATLENGHVEEMPSEEWYAVIRNDTGRSVYEMLFPTETRALAFLYKVANPKAWAAYLKARDEAGKEN